MYSGFTVYNSRRVTLYMYRYFICLLPSRVDQGWYGYTGSRMQWYVCQGMAPLLQGLVVILKNTYILYSAQS